MPIYEFFCKDCNTIFNFFASRPDTGKKPVCPRCGAGPLQKLMSRFSAISGKNDNRESAEAVASPDQARMEEAMAGMLQAAEQMDERDPRQLARLMRCFADKSGLPLHEPMAEALARLEAGQDPEQIEAEMEDAMDQWETPFNLTAMEKRSRLENAPLRRDERLYEL